MLACYRQLGPRSNRFDAVWHSGMVINELRLEEYGLREPSDVADTIGVFDEDGT